MARGSEIPAVSHSTNVVSFVEATMGFTKNDILFLMKYPHAIPIAIALVGSLIFLSIPSFSGILYVKDRLNISGITQNEWIWTVLCSGWVLLVFLLPSQRLKWMITENRTFIIFLVVNLLWMVVPLYHCIKHCTNLSPQRIVSMIGGKAAWPALWNAAIVCFPVQRVSPILEAMGLSSKQAVPFHIWAANATLVWLLVHAILLSLVYIWETESLSEWLSLMLPYKSYYTEGVVNFMGWLGLIFFLGIWVTSLPVVQRKSYEAFRILHWIFSALFLLGSNLHDYNTWFFIQPAIIMMTVDFILRKYSNLTFEESVEQGTSNLCVQEGKVDISTKGEIASLTFPIPNSWPQLDPGMYVYLTVESISRWQSHPYSISKTNRKERTFTIHVKTLGDWSTEFVSTAKDACESPLADSSSSWIIEGPYGSPALYTTVQCYKHCIFLAGGVGITGISALAEARCRPASGEVQEGYMDEDRTTSVLWMVQNVDEANFLIPLVRDDENNTICDNMHVWITRGRNPASIGDESGEGGHIPPLRASRKARWRLSFQCQKWAVLFASILSSLIILAVSRYMCKLQPSKSGIPYTRDYSFLWHSATCESCEIEDIVDTNRSIDVPCCTVPVALYGFRGLPIILSFFLMGPLTLLFARTFNALWLRSCGRSFLGYASINSHSTENQTTAHNDDEEDLSGIEIIRRGSPHFSELSQGGSENLEFHWGARPENSSTLFSSQYLPSELFSDGIDNHRDVIVVVCGPQKLVETTKKELALDPVRRHWRVVLAS